MITIIAEVKAVSPKREKLERDVEKRVLSALQAWGASLFKGITADSVAAILTRIDDPQRLMPFRDALIAALQDAAALGVAEAQADIERDVLGVKRTPIVDTGGANWELPNIDAWEWARQYAGMLVRGIQDTTRRAVAAEVQYFTQNSLTINQLRDRIMGIDGGVFGEVRARRIAVTEVTRAYAEGNRAAWGAMDYVEGYEWNTANDERVCPICGPLHNVVVKKGELFAGIYNGPPAHVNCRCSMSPVVIGDTERFETGVNLDAGPGYNPTISQ